MIIIMHIFSKMLQLLGKTVWQLIRNFKIELPYDPEFLLLGIFPQELQKKDSNVYLYILILSSIAHDNPKMERTQMWIGEWTDKTWQV